MIEGTEHAGVNYSKPREDGIQRTVKPSAVAAEKVCDPLLYCHLIHGPDETDQAVEVEFYVDDGADSEGTRSCAEPTLGEELLNRVW